MNKFESDYKDLVNKILIQGEIQENRTKSDALVLFSENLLIELNGNEAPVLTSKKIFYKKALAEFTWILTGHTNIDYLNNHNIHWWDSYADKNGELGKTYGYQLRNYNGHFDQLAYVISEINKNSRRAHITMWNPSELKETALPCCYTGFTFVIKDNKLNMSMQFRSSDVFLGLPYDILFGFFLLKYVCKKTNLKMGRIKLNLENAHIYKNNYSAACEYLKREQHPLPTISDNLELQNYKHEAFIKATLNK